MKDKNILHFFAGAIFLLFILCLPFVFKGVACAQWFEDKLPPLPPPSQYGNLLINRVSGKSDMLPPTFSHWRHRVKYTCRVCHSELGFEMKVNTTEITMEKIRKGQFCGACHDDVRSFGVSDCKKCHTGEIYASREKFKKLSSLPKARYGNRIDWSKALEKRLIKPKKTLLDEPLASTSFNKLLSLDAEWNSIPPAIFPHELHNDWLDCSNCHPDIFNIKKKTTKHFDMIYMLDGKFCGACHLKIAFPLDDCRRCHPGIREK